MSTNCEQKLPTVKAFVYAFDPIMVEKYPEKFAENPPKARYMEILQEGANYFSLDRRFVEIIHLNIEIIPRKPLNELKRLKLPEGSLPAWNFQMMQENDKENKEIIFLALNNKIVRFDLNGITENIHFIRKDRGTHFAFQIASKYWYEPKYGVSKQVEDM